MAVLDSCSLPSISNAAEGVTGGPFEDTTLLSVRKVNTIHENYQPKNCNIVADAWTRSQSNKGLLNVTATSTCLRYWINMFSWSRALVFIYTVSK
jgi:hypothetical protein